MPLAVLADGGRVYVLDGAAKRVIALNAADGALLWATGTAGGGPGEFNTPTAFTASPAGDLLIADARNVRITVLDPDGRVVRHIPLGAIGHVQGMCALPGGDVLLSTLEREGPIIRLSSNGKRLHALDLPWPELARVPPLGRQAFLGNSRDAGGCALALAMGRGFARYRDGRFAAVHDYLEPVAPPTVETRVGPASTGHARSEHIAGRQVAATSLHAEGGVLAMSFEGRTSAAGRIIDRYDLRTGRYRESYEYSRPLLAIAQAGATHFLLHYSAGFPTLVAAVPASPGAAAHP